ncbi:MAG: hypothetical protein ACFE0O_01605 [Opitutales bacterium]
MQTSWKGHRLAQHRAFYAFSLEEKLKAVEEMADFARKMRGDDAPQKRDSIDSEGRTDNPNTPAFKVDETQRDYRSTEKR